MAGKRLNPSSKEAPVLVGYVRVSTSEQVESGLSLEAQEAKIRAYCTSQDFKVLAIEVDAGESGSVAPTKRPGLAKALRRLECDDAHGLIVLRLDRLSRSAMDTLSLAERFKKKEWLLISVAENLDSHTPSGRLFLTMLAGMNQHEREIIAERTKTALARLAQQNRARSRFVPFGFRLSGFPQCLQVPKGSNSRLVEHSREQAILRRMLRHRSEGLGPRRIAERLNTAGLNNPRTRRPWTPALIQRLIATVDRRASVSE